MMPIMNSRCISGFLIDDAPPPTTPARAVNPKPDNASVILRGVAVPLTSDVGIAFTVDCCRNREKIFSDARLQEKYSIDPSDWNDILNNKVLRLAISAESDRRMLNGTAATESAAKIFTESPEAMGSILRDNKASARSRVAASQELRATARAGDEKSSADTERVIVNIKIGEDRYIVDSGPLPPNRLAPENHNVETEE